MGLAKVQEKVFDVHFRLSLRGRGVTWRGTFRASRDITTRLLLVQRLVRWGGLERLLQGSGAGGDSIGRRGIVLFDILLIIASIVVLLVCLVASAAEGRAASGWVLDR
jgi:hypothetical protein